MSILDWFRSDKTEQRASISNHGLTGNDLVSTYGGGDSCSGVVVNYKTAMQVAAVQACVQIISQDVADKPFIVYGHSEHGRQKAKQHPLYKLLHDYPNENMSSKNFRQALTISALLHGNGYAYIKKVNARPVALYPLRPNEVTPFFENGELKYDVKFRGKDEILTPDQIFHIKGNITYDGIRGLGPLQTSPNVLGVSIAIDRFTQEYFANGTMLSGVLTAENRVTDEVKANLKSSWANMYSGVGNSHKTPLLEEGIKFEPMSSTPEVLQLTEIRKYQVEECCRLFRVPAHKTNLLDRATFSNIEEQNIDYIQSNLKNWIYEWEQEANRKLFLESEKDKYFAEILLDSLMRGNQTARYSNFGTAIQNGWLTPKRVAEMDNLSTEGLSDTPIQPLNMAPATDSNQTDSNSDSSSSAADSESKPGPNASRDYSILIEDAARRVLTKECNAIKRAAKKYKDDAAAFDSWATDFYADHESTIRSTFQPVMLTCFENEAHEMLDSIVLRHTRQSLQDLQQAENIDDFLNAQMSKANNGDLWIAKI